MPNWCFTYYRICGDRKEIQELYSLMKQLEDREESLVENGFGKTWLGNLVTALGEDWERIYCRGYWYDLELLSDTEISLGIESAWCEMREVRHLIQSKFPTIKALFITEEPGMCIYETNDVDGLFFTHLHVVEGEDFETQEFETAAEAKEYIETIIGRKLTTDEDLGETLYDWAEAHGTYASYNVYEIVND